MNEPTEQEVTASYNGRHCIFCKVKPGLTGRLAMIIINGAAAWRCTAQACIDLANER